MKEMVGGCCVCSDERGWPDNPLVYCDGNGCTVAVHQACYGIVTVPTGPWYCRKCETPEAKGKVKCELCPSKSGALKRTDTGGWAHVVCALYIPEVRFGNVTSMEPIVLRLIPPERFNKTCYICQDSHKSHRASAGACMQCNKSGCKQQFHVTCAQSLGLLCEEAGNYLDNVKYCGYCQHHYSKLKKGGNVKTIPPYKPVVNDGQSSDSSGEKEGSSPAGGSTTPTHAVKPKGPGRKSSHGSGSGKNTPNSSKTPTSNPPSDKKKSPSRRGSSASEAGGGSKHSTPTPSPQHTSDLQLPAPSGTPKAGGSTPSGSKAAPSSSPNASKPPESPGVISTAASAQTPPPNSTASSAASSPSVVQAGSKPAYQESVITNAEAMETKQTKKRKAITQANAQAAYSASTATASNEINTQSSSNNNWESRQGTDVQMENKAGKKAKTDSAQAAGNHHSSPLQIPLPPPPPPAHSPATRHQPSQIAGPSGGMNQPQNLRSPAMGTKSDWAGATPTPLSLLVSVPLPATSHGLNLSVHAKAAAGASNLSGSSSHVFHQPQTQAATEPGVSGHSQHGTRSWGGLNVAYEMQQDPSKPGVSGMAGNKDNGAGLGQGPVVPPITIRNKKRAALAASMANSVLTNSQAQAQAAAATQSLAISVRRPPQPPTPSPVYHETIKDSPPSSPSSDRPLRQMKMESSSPWSGRVGAPHMLGNELNPASGAAARLQEQLNAELAAHAAGAPQGDHLVLPPLINKAHSGSSSSRSGSSAQSLDQLLERQWEQGSQFLMEQAQHFDIASLLSCLHQLRTENVRLEDHVGGLLQRRDHLLAVNARLAIPLTTVTTGPPPEQSRCPRDVSQPRAPSAPMRPPETVTSERQQLMMRESGQKPS